MTTDNEQILRLKSVLKIVSTGICCPIGYTSAAATAAMRAQLNIFAQSQYVDETGNPLICSQLEGVNLWGTERIVWMFNQAVEESLSKLKNKQMAETLLLILAPEKNRPGTDDSWPKRLLQSITKNKKLHNKSKIYYMGCSGIADALSFASETLSNDPEIQFVVLAGADSLLNSGTIQHYLANDRLLTAENGDGFIPGEAAASLVLTLASSNSKGVFIKGLGHAREKAHYLQDDLPNRAVAMTEALRRAAANAGMKIADCNFHLSSISGSAWYSKEATMAIGRAIEQRVTKFPHQLIADKVGEVGAAAGVLGLAYLFAVLPRADSFGSKAIFHLSSDDARRVAMIVCYNQ